MQNVSKVVFLILAACISSSGFGQTNQPIASENTSIRIGGVDNDLYLSAGNMMETKKGKYVFQYFIDDNNNISLRGWKAHGLHGRKFQSNHNLSLINGPQYNDGDFRADETVKRTYFGDLVVARKGIRKVKKMLKEGYQTVIFVPVRYMNTAFTAYKIYVLKENLLALAKEQKGAAPPRNAVYTEVDANPSPPRGFDN